MTKEEIVKVIKLASNRDMIQETMQEISKEFSHYDYDLHVMVQDSAPEVILLKELLKKFIINYTKIQYYNTLEL